MRNAYKTIIIAHILSVALIAVGGAGESATDDALTPEQSASRLKRLPDPDPWDARHRYYSERLAAAIDRLDRFFGDDRVVEDNRRSSLLLGIGLRTDRKKGTSLVSDIRLRMVMPRLKERLQIVLDDILEVDDPENEQAIINAVRDTRPDAGLRYIFSESDKIRLSGDVGIRTGSPYQVFWRGRWRLILPIHCWETRLTETAYWLTDDGWRLSSALDLTRPVGDWFFRSSSRVTWEELRNGATFGQTLALTYAQSKRRGYRFYTSGVWPESPHTRTANYTVGAVYRQRIHRDWLFVELTSAVEFPQADNYEPNPIAGIKLEVLFSQYPHL